MYRTLYYKKGPTMVNMVNSVSVSLISARSQVKLAETAVDVFQVAKAKHDNAMADRAISYATPAIGEALSRSEEASEALSKAQKAAQDEARKELEKEIKEPSKKQGVEENKQTTIESTEESSANNPQAEVSKEENTTQISGSDIQASPSQDTKLITENAQVGMKVDISA